MIKQLACALLLFSAFNTSHAALVERDFLIAGDSLLTYDESSGLEWLDLPVVEDHTWSQLQARLSSNGDLFGFRLATEEELIALFTEVGIVKTLTPHYFIPNQFGEADEVAYLLGLLAGPEIIGVQARYDGEVPSYFPDPPDDAQNFWSIGAWIEVDHSWSEWDGWIAGDVLFKWPTYSFVVRETQVVPIPASGWLLLCALTSFAITARKKRNANGKFRQGGFKH